MHAVAHLDREVHGGVLAVAVVESNGVDVGVLFGNRRRHGGEHTALVFRLDPEIHRVHALDVLLPLHVDPLLGVFAVTHHVRAILGMHHDTAPGGEKAEDGIAGNGTAAARISDHHALRPVNGQHRFLRLLAAAAEQPQETARLVFFDLRHQLARDHGGQAVAQADLAQQIVPGFQLQGFQQGLTGFLGKFLQVGADVLERRREQTLAELGRLLDFLVLEKVADMRPGLAGHHVIEPGRVGTAVRRSDDLDVIAIAQGGAQRHELMVDLGANAAVADVGVHVVGEIDDGGVARQFLDLAVGREHVDLVREQVHLEVFQEFPRVAGLLLGIQQVLEPLERALLRRVRTTLAALVQPVRGDPGLGHAVHLARADLHFKGNAERAEHHGVQGLVAVGLGNRDVVLEPPGDGLVEIVNHPKRAVAGVGLVHDHAETVNVIHLLERQVLLLHLAVHAVQAFLAPGHLGGQSLALQLADDGAADFLDDGLAVAVTLAHRVGDDAIAQRVQRGKPEIAQLRRPLAHAQAVGDGRVDIERLARHGAAAFGTERGDGAHVVQAVGELDQNHADIARHGEQHLAEILRLRLFLRLEFNAGDLGDAVHELCDIVPEFLGNAFLRRGRVLDDVVQDRRRDALGVEAHFRQDAGDFYGMVDVGFAANAALSLVGLGAEQVGRINVSNVAGLEIGFEYGAQVTDLKPLPGASGRSLRLRFRPLCRGPGWCRARLFGVGRLCFHRPQIRLAALPLPEWR